MTGSNKKEKYDKILERKVGTSTESLCRGYPIEFQTYMTYCKTLGFEDRPDYAYLKRMFKDLYTKEFQDYDYLFDWIVPRPEESDETRDNLTKK